MSIMRFLIRPLPKKTEHLLAFMMRVSWLNHMRSLKDLLLACGLKTLNDRIAYRKLVTGDFDKDVLAGNLQLDVSFLQDNAVNISPTKTMAFNHSFPTDMLDFSHPKLCRQCFEINGYFPFSSAIVPMAACPKHGCRLTTHWRNGQQLSWGEQNLCSKLIDDTDDLTRASGDSIELSILIVRLSNRVPNTGLPEPLHLLALFDLMLVLRFIVRFDKRIPGVRGPKHIPPLAWSDAYSILKKWPSSIFPLFLDCEINGLKTHAGNGVRAAYRDLYDELYAGPYRSSYAYFCLRCAFETFISRPDSATPLWSPNLKLLSDKCIQKISCKQSMQLLGLRERGLERLINLNLLGDAISTVSGVRLLNKSDVLRFASEQHHFINLSELCKLLEVNRATAVQLVTCGTFPCVARPDSVHRDWLFDSREISNLIELLKKKCNKLIKHGCGASQNPMRKFHFRGKTTAEIINEMLCGQLKFTYHPNNHSPLSLTQFSPFANDEPELYQFDYLTPRQVALMLGVNINAVYDLVKLGYLNRQMVKLPRHTREVCLISIDSVNDFQTKYSIKPQTRRALTCVSGPKIDGALLNIYRKSYTSEGSNNE